jgi:endonuclease YncB( thermonuclease family)
MIARSSSPEGRNLGQEFVRAGLAWHYVHFAKQDTLLPALEQEARSAKRGRWTDPSPCRHGGGGSRSGGFSAPPRPTTLRDPLSE